ncbi:aquaporin-like protein [Hypoxylon trugodes]|uniref:aquaporin-like protein n=1 Tax=Hypoxylon trugodes TaxID=326681 RepID=UPI0021980485|nr:aquaporin-like protein [Hypoxylon trugodes]KAI1388731.1 aquaporin-like protein [Hypoxylon trugodes]
MENTDFNTHIRRPWEHPQDIDNHSEKSNRLKLLDILPLPIKNHIIATMSEFAGTFMFLLFAFGGTNAVNTNLPGDTPADPARLLFISLCFGMSLAVNAWVFFRISGGLFNPAVTLGMMLVGAVDYIRGPLVILSQILGGIAASAVVWGLTPGPLNVGTSLGGGTSVVQGLFIEMFLTAQLVFTIFMLAAEKHRATFIAPVGIGLSLFIAELMGVYYTGGSVNPTRSFGPNVVMGKFPHYHWIYWVGPVLGSLVASGFYIFIKALEYETVNPQQDQISEEPAVSKPSSRQVEHRDRWGDEGTVMSGRSNASYAGGPSMEAARIPT